MVMFVLVLLLNKQSTIAAKHTYEGPMIDAHAHAVQWSKSWMISDKTIMPQGIVSRRPRQMIHASRIYVNVD